VIIRTLIAGGGVQLLRGIPRQRAESPALTRVEFLEARIGEDEEWARASGGPLYSERQER
jgi:hypothetical protein